MTAFGTFFHASDLSQSRQEDPHCASFTFLTLEKRKKKGDKNKQSQRQAKNTNHKRKSSSVNLWSLSRHSHSSTQAAGCVHSVRVDVFCGPSGTGEALRDGLLSSALTTSLKDVKLLLKFRQHSALVLPSPPVKNAVSFCVCNPQPGVAVRSIATLLPVGRWKLTTGIFQ